MLEALGEPAGRVPKVATTMQAERAAEKDYYALNLGKRRAEPGKLFSGKGFAVGKQHEHIVITAPDITISGARHEAAHAAHQIVFERTNPSSGKTRNEPDGLLCEVFAYFHPFLLHNETQARAIVTADLQHWRDKVVAAKGDPAAPNQYLIACKKPAGEIKRALLEIARTKYTSSRALDRWRTFLFK